eukprot:3121498-Rhodomonas_salina.2
MVHASESRGKCDLDRVVFPLPIPLGSSDRLHGYPGTCGFSGVQRYRDGCRFSQLSILNRGSLTRRNLLWYAPKDKELV